MYKQFGALHLDPFSAKRKAVGVKIGFSAPTSKFRYCMKIARKLIKVKKSTSMSVHSTKTVSTYCVLLIKQNSVLHVTHWEVHFF